MIHPAPRIKHDGCTRAALDREAERTAIYTRDCGRCQTCGALLAWDAFELAHRIADTKAARRKYGAEIIDHPLNRAVTCRGRCNDAVLIDHDIEAREELIDRILAEGKT